MIKKARLMEDLVEMVQGLPGYKEADRVFVSVYREEQFFGGPEEGGWWYTRMALEGSVEFTDRRAAESWLAAAQARVEEENHMEAPSRARAFASLPDEDEVPCPANCPEGYIPADWSDGGELRVIIEETKGEHDNSNEPRPHYE